MRISPVESNGCMKPVGIEDIVVNANGRTLGTTLIEDNSQTVSEHTKGCISTYSFASTKHLTLGGQGGAICCDDKETFDKLSKLKDLGRNDRQQLKPMSDKFEEWGFNSKVTELQAAFGLAQLDRVPKRLERLSTMASIYHDIISKCQEVEFFNQDAKWHLDIKVSNPQMVIDRMKKHKIYCKRYMTPLHMQPIASKLVPNVLPFAFNNDFVKTAVLDKNIDIFGAQAYRPLCHVEDISEAVRLVIEYDAPKEPTIFNVGSSKQNYTKEEIANTIGDLTGAKITFTDNEEKRNYMVDFTKIKKELGFTTTHTLQDGINTMANALKNKEIELVGSNV